MDFQNRISRSLLPWVWISIVWSTFFIARMFCITSLEFWSTHTRNLNPVNDVPSYKKVNKDVCFDKWSVRTSYHDFQTFTQPQKFLMNHKKQAHIRVCTIMKLGYIWKLSWLLNTKFHSFMQKSTCYTYEPLSWQPGSTHDFQFVNSWHPLEMLYCSLGFNYEYSKLYDFFFK